MGEVTSKRTGPPTKKYIIGKPVITPANLAEVDLEQLSQDIQQRNVALFALGATDGGDKDGDCDPEMNVMRHPETNEVHSLSADLTDDHVTELKERHKSALIIEEDAELFMQAVPGLFEMSQAPAMIPEDAKELKVMLKVVDQDGAAIPNALVDLSGTIWSDEQITNAQGKVTLRLADETLDSLEELRVKPTIGFWSKIIEAPNLALKDNVVTLEALSTTLDGAQQRGWGNDAVGTVAMPGPNRIRVAVIDSGFAEGHPDVTAADGRSLNAGADPEEDWKIDGTGHGTHVAGTIGALNNAIGMRGVADRVDIIPLRVFPNASFSKLMAAIDMAIALQVDVVNMSLGGTKQSELLQQRLQAARDAGILLIAAAGNSGGPVMYPAAYPQVMAVAAIGQHGSFPADSFHSRHETNVVSADGKSFSAAFTCHGPEIDVCGPGVAIVSTLPGPGFGAMDGTSMASPHIAGVAAVLLSQSADIQAMSRNTARSEALFDKVVSQCQTLGLPAERQGHGMPVLTGAPVPPQPAPDTDTDTDSDLDTVADLIRRALEAARQIKETT